MTMNSKQEGILDDLWSRAVRNKAKGICQWSGADGQESGCQACHVVGRRYLSTRWGAIIDGKYDLCGFYANYKIHQAYDQHKIQRSNIIDNMIGRKRYDAIIKKSQEIADNLDFDAIAMVLRTYK